jgi:enoyl-CoA hydratase/carnithine racemase
MAEDNGPISSALNGHVLTIHIDRSDKMNGFNPEMSDQLADAMTELEEEPAALVGELTFAGKHTTAGLDLPRFSGSMKQGSSTNDQDNRVDAFAL